MSYKNNLIENNYVVIRNFIDKDRANWLYDSLKQYSILNETAFNKDIQCPKSLAIYNYRWFVELLVEQTYIMSQLLEEPMLPTYSYARLYNHDDDLKKHKDRNACEVSVTLHIGSDGTEWPIYFTKPNNEVISVNLYPGDAAIYLGCISEHWREKFSGNEYGQVFLHYVRSRGANWNQYFDKAR